MRTIPLLMSVVLSVLLSACASMGPGDAVQKRSEIQKMKRDTLTKLYSKKPDVRAQLSNAPGYAVFSNANLNIIFVAAGTGYGVVENNTTGQSTYMNMAEGGVGLGLGAKDYRIVMVFHTQMAMKQFVESGWTFGGNADAAARAADKGASIEGEVYYGDVTVYTFTESGLALQATVKGTKFWQDKELD